MNQPIQKDIKDQILARVREGKETVVNIAKQHGVKEVFVDGRKIQGNLIEPHGDGKIHKVKVVLG